MNTTTKTGHNSPIHGKFQIFTQNKSIGPNTICVDKTSRFEIRGLVNKETMYLKHDCTWNEDLKMEEQ